MSYVNNILKYYIADFDQDWFFQIGLTTFLFLASPLYAIKLATNLKCVSRKRFLGKQCSQLLCPGRRLPDRALAGVQRFTAALSHPLGMAGTWRTWRTWSRQGTCVTFAAPWRACP
jgi:hypothetical protein